MTHPTALVLHRADGAPVATEFRRAAFGNDDPFARSCAAACERPTKTGVVALRANAEFKPSKPPPAETLLGPTPRCRSDNVFTDDGAQYIAGTWDSTPYHRVVRAHRRNEPKFFVVQSAQA